MTGAVTQEGHKKIARRIAGLGSRHDKIKLAIVIKIATFTLVGNGSTVTLEFSVNPPAPSPSRTTATPSSLPRIWNGSGHQIQIAVVIEIAGGQVEAVRNTFVQFRGRDDKPTFPIVQVDQN